MTEPEQTTPDPEPTPDPVVGSADPDPQPDTETPPDADALGAQAEANAVELPSGERLAEVGAIIALRRELKAVKEKAKDGDAAAQRAAELEQQIAELAPMAEAFRAMSAAQSAQAEPAQPAAVDTAGLEELARQLDFYRPDGELDTARAAKFQALIDKTAEAKAQQQVAPLVQQSVRDKAAANIQKALRTVHPVNGDMVDPNILASRFAQIAQQPGGVEVLADEQAVKELWLNSYGLNSLKPRQKAAAAAVTPPVVSDRSGGNAVVGTSPTLDAKDRQVAKEYGLSDAEYLKLAAKMPW
ncbi:MAG: hypothetical protein AB7P99_04690 [Vicinamibacterales bacterium]